MILKLFVFLFVQIREARILKGSGISIMSNILNQRTVWAQCTNAASELIIDIEGDKAGLPANYWSKTLQVYRYTVESYHF